MNKKYKANELYAKHIYLSYHRGASDLQLQSFTRKGSVQKVQ